MKEIMSALLVLSILVLVGCVSKSSTFVSGECPVGEPNCDDFVVNPPIENDGKEVMPGCVGDECSIPPATEDRNISKPPASETP